MKRWRTESSYIGAMIYAALTGRKEATCGPDLEPDGCGTAQLTTCCTETEEAAS
jgi:hypothetical protein